MSQSAPQSNSSVASVVHTIRWSEICPWLLLFRAARVALLVRVILLALVGVLATQVGWTLIESALLDDRSDGLARLVDRKEVDEASGVEIILRSPRDEMEDAPKLGGDWIRRAKPLTAPFEFAEENWLAGPFVRGWAWAVQPLSAQLQISGWQRWLWTLSTGVWTIAVWGLFGGAIARIAALYLTRLEKTGPLVALKAAAANWTTTVGAPAAAYAGVLLSALPLVAAGFVMRLSFLAVLAGALWFIALLIGAAAFVLALGLLLSWPLMWAAAAVERSDAFDAISRAFAYLTQRPLHALCYVVIASALGLVCETGVSIGAEGVVAMTDGAVAKGLGDEAAAMFAPGVDDDRPPRSRMERGASAMVRFWSYLLLGAAQAFPLAYVWPAAVGIYLLLRRHVDATELDEVSVDRLSEREPLPPLVNNPKTGVPTVEKDATADPPAQTPLAEDDPPSESPTDG